MLTPPADPRIRWIPTPLCRLLVLALFCTTAVSSAQYMDDLRMERAFVKAMLANPQPMLDYVEMQLGLMEKAFPGDSDAVKVSYSEFYIAQGQRTKALNKLAEIPKSSRYYADAALKRTTLATDDKEREKAYKDYFDVVKEPPTHPDEIDEFVSLVFKYYMTLVRQGQNKKADAVLALTKQLPKDKQLNPNMLIFMKSQAVLESADELVKEKKPLGAMKSQVEKTLADLNNLIWNMDFVTGLAYGEIAHAQILLDKPDDALKVLNDSTTFLLNLEKGMLQQKVAKAASPVAPAFYYAGEAYMKKARAFRGKNDAKMIENLKLALPKFYKVATEYKGAPIETKAVARTALVQKILESKGVEIDFKGQQEQKMKYEAGLAMLRTKEYGKAGALFLECAALNLRGSTVPEALKFAIVCLYKTERYLEAMAIADFLYEWYPRSEETQTGLYNLAVTMIKAKVNDADSMSILGRFARVAPDHPKAPWAAYRVAEYQYKVGTKLKKDKQAAEAAGKSTEEVNEMILKMREAYMASVPLYTILTDNYGTTEYGAKSYYKLAWVYHIVGDNEKAADNFLRYCDAQESPTEQKAEAKFFAGDRLMRANLTADAIECFDELIKWTNPQTTEFPKTDKVKNYRISAIGLINWCYDKRYRDLKAESESLQEQLANWGKEKEAPEDGAEAPKDAPAPEKAPEKAPEGTETAENPDDEPKLTPEQEKAQLDAREKKLRAEAHKFRQKAIEGFTKFVAKYPKSAQHADNMFKLGSLYLEDKDYANAATVLGGLIKQHPDSNAAKIASFHLGRAYAENGEWEKASATLQGSLPSFPTMSSANLGFIAGGLYQPKPNNDKPGLDAALVLAANQEIVKRSRDKKHADYAKLEPLRERALFRASQAHLALKQFDETVELSDRVLAEQERENLERERKGLKKKESPYYFDILFNKGTAYYAKGDYVKSLQSFEYVLTYINSNKYPAKYYRGVCECGRTLVASGDAKKGAARFMQVVRFANPEDAGVKQWVELAYLEGARALNKIGDKAGAEKLQKEYLSTFSDGQYKTDIMDLSGGTRAPAPAPAPPAPGSE